MSLGTDTILERIRLKAQLVKWRGAAIAFAAFLAYFLLGGDANIFPGRSYIARVNITGLVQEDPERDAKLKALADDSEVAAIIVHVNTPGGTVVGGENLYNIFREISKTKPVVSVMGTLATSAGYMVALGSRYIVAGQGSLTGSIGVILHTAEVLDLAKKLGVNVDIIKSGPFKASPSPFERMTPEVRQSIQSVINDYNEVFIDMVAEGRKLPKDEVRKIADGRVFTGRQALAGKLVDELGSEDEAVRWLNEKAGVSIGYVREVKLEEEKGSFSGLFDSLHVKNNIIPELLSLQGLLSVWASDIM